jgi:hypothetical protein
MAGASRLCSPTVQQLQSPAAGGLVELEAQAHTWLGRWALASGSPAGMGAMRLHDGGRRRTFFSPQPLGALGDDGLSLPTQQDVGLLPAPTPQGRHRGI